MFGNSISDFVSVENRRYSKKNLASQENRFDVDLRLVILQFIIFACFLLLFASLINSQIFAGNYYRGLANGNRIRQIPIHAPRGIIFDRNEIPLTINLPAFRLTECNEKKKCSSQSISKDQAISFETGGPSQKNRLEIDSSRSYPFGPAFAHVLGYVSEISEDELKNDGSYLLGDKVGRGGIEAIQESKLRGKTGKELIEVDATGKKIRTISKVEPTSGENLILSIDSNLQKVAYKSLGDYKGAVVVSKPQTGEILALVSTPAFDPNFFTDLNLSVSERSEKIQGLFDDPSEPLFDRAISGSFPPGSTFKIVTATAGLETGAIKASTVIEDTGVLVIGPFKFPNWKWLKDGGVDGNLDVVGGIQKSNDIFFYKTGEWIGIDNLMAWAKKFGLGEKLGIDLPGENSGLVPDKGWRDTHTRSWYLGDTYHVAIGQGDLLVTPLQDNTWTNVIANGGKLCTPHLLGEAHCKELGIKRETLDLVKKGMVAACSSGGTGYPFFGFTPQVACKTGTAEFGPSTSSGYRTHAWFTSFAQDISVTVLVEGAGEGSDFAAPIAKKIFEAWFGK